MYEKLDKKSLKMNIFFRNTSYIIEQDIDTLISDVNRNDYDVIILLETLKRFEIDYKFPLMDKYNVVFDLNLNRNVLVFIKKSLTFEIQTINKFAINFSINDFLISAFYRPPRHTYTTAQHEQEFSAFIAALNAVGELSTGRLVLIGDINFPIHYEDGCMSVKQLSSLYSKKNYEDLRRFASTQDLEQVNEYTNSANNIIDVLFKRRMNNFDVNVQLISVDSSGMILNHKQEGVHNTYLYTITEQ